MFSLGNYSIVSSKKGQKCVYTEKLESHTAVSVSTSWVGNPEALHACLKCVRKNFCTGAKSHAVLEWGSVSLVCKFQAAQASKGSKKNCMLAIGNSKLLAKAMWRLWEDKDNMQSPRFQFQSTGANIAQFPFRWLFVLVPKKRDYYKPHYVVSPWIYVGILQDWMNHKKLFAFFQWRH